MVTEVKNTNQDSTQFEIIASRLDTYRGEIQVVTSLLRKSVNNLTGSEPSDTEEKKQSTSGVTDSILSELNRLLDELEYQVQDLQHEQNRLSKLLAISL